MVDVPNRLELGKIYCGPEFHGCSNSGRRVGLMRSATFKRCVDLADGYRYAVGSVMWLEDAVKARVGINGAVPSGRLWRHRGSDSVVYFFKIARSAKQKFRLLCRPAEEFNARAAAEIDYARRRLCVDPLDTGAALVLGDHGEI